MIAAKTRTKERMWAVFQRFNLSLRKPDWHNLRRLDPISRSFGFDRGIPIDRYYIDKFLSQNVHHIKGNVLEVAENTYTMRFGKGVHKSDVLHVSKDAPNVTIVGDLCDLSTLPENAFDCFICTQTYNFIYDIQSALRGTRHLLKHGGVVLATVAGISQISRYDMDRWGDYWRFTTLSAQRIFEKEFGTANVEIDSYGNVLSAISFLEGLSSRELSANELDYRDKDYQLLVTIVARK